MYYKPGVQISSDLPVILLPRSPAFALPRQSRLYCELWNEIIPVEDIEYAGSTGINN